MTEKKTFHDLFRQPGAKLGLFSMEFATAGLPYVVRAAGADFLVLDLEHSGFSYETAKVLALAAKGAGLPLALRIPHRHANEVSRALDAGADAIMAPLVSTAADAEAIVRWASYPPEGSRGVGLNLAHDLYRPGPAMAKTAAANASRCVIVQIETGEGAANADAIAAVDGVDCLWIGHMDLSYSLGIPGGFDRPEYAAAAGQVREATRRHGKSLGRLAGSEAEARRLIAEGYDTIAVYSDVGALQQRLAEAITSLRSRP